MDCNGLIGWQRQRQLAVVKAISNNLPIDWQFCLKAVKVGGGGLSGWQRLCQLAAVKNSWRRLKLLAAAKVVGSGESCWRRRKWRRGK